MTSTEQGRRKYDALADRYEEIFYYVADVGQRLLSFAEPPNGARLLDVGAGRGAVARAALLRGCAVTAVDASAGMVSRLAADYPDMVVRQQDAGRLGFADGTFDVVTAGFVVQVLTDLPVALAEFRRVLAPGGTLAVSVERQEAGNLAWLHELTQSFFGGTGTGGGGGNGGGGGDGGGDGGGGGDGDGDADGDQTRSPLTADELDESLVTAGFTSPTRVTVDIPKRLPDPAALWDWLAMQGVAAAVDTLPTDQAVAFRERFFRHAEDMHRDGGITLTFGATLHRTTTP